MVTEMSEGKRRRKADMEAALEVPLFTWGEVRERAPTAALATIDVVEGMEAWPGRDWILGALRKRTGRTLWRLDAGRAWRARWPSKRFEPQTCTLCGISEEARVWHGLCWRCFSWATSRDPYRVEQSRDRVAQHRERKRILSSYLNSRSSP